MINGRKIGFLASGAFADMPVMQVCDILGSIGYDAVELSTAHIDKCDTGAKLAEMRRSVEDAGMEISECVVQQDYIARTSEERSAAIERTVSCIRRCADAGIRTVNLFTGPRPWIGDRVVVGEHISATEAWDMLFHAFDIIVPLAEREGVAIAVENVWGMLCCDFFTLQHLVRHYDSPCLGVNFDPSHDLLHGNTDMEFLLRQWGRQRVKHIHLKDAAGSQQRGKVLFPPLGTGLVDWDSFVRGINAIGYDGVMSVEYEADQHLFRNLNGDWVRAAEESYAAVKAILK